MASLKLTSHDPAQTVAFGIQLGQLLGGGEVICLSGDLGAGKTALTSGIAKGWGALETVTSPTFVLIHEHRRRVDDQRLYHLDCYRLGTLEDAETIGVEDILASNDVAIIEWPERIRGLLPDKKLWIDLEQRLDEDTERIITLESSGERYEILIEKLTAEVS